MNDKEQAIKDLIAALPLGENPWILVDHWDADLCAIGIARADQPRQLVYVSSFGRSTGRYDYECETPKGPQADEYTTTTSGEDVDFETLLDIIRRHLAFSGAWKRAETVGWGEEQTSAQQW